MSALIKIDHSYASSVAERANATRFCSRCAQAAEPAGEGERPLAQMRVCQACGMGMLLRCAQEALPGARGKFLIATVELEVTAISEAAEVLFGVEDGVLGRSLLELLSSPGGDDDLGRVVRQAAMRPRDPTVLPVRGLAADARAPGIMAARVSTCGPPRAALVSVEQGGFGRR